MNYDSGRRRNCRSFAAVSKGRWIVAWWVKLLPDLFARPLSFIRPAKNPAALHFRLLSRHLPGFGLRRPRRRGRQILALHRVNQLAVFGPANRSAVIDTRGRALG